MHKQILSIAFLAILSGPAHAEDVPMSPIDCAALRSTPFLCVRNYRPVTIAEITCIGNWFGSANLPLPPNGIRGGGTSVISFDSGKCEQTIRITYRDGQIYNIYKFDVNNSTVLDIHAN